MIWDQIQHKIEKGIRDCVVIFPVKDAWHWMRVNDKGASFTVTTKHLSARAAWEDIKSDMAFANATDSTTMFLRVAKRNFVTRIGAPSVEEVIQDAEDAR